MAKRLNCEIEVQDKPYNPELVKEILNAEQSIKDGKGIKMNIEDIDNLWK